jgi:hypothetical protein
MSERDYRITSHLVVVNAMVDDIGREDAVGDFFSGLLVGRVYDRPEFGFVRITAQQGEGHINSFFALADADTVNNERVVESGPAKSERGGIFQLGGYDFKFGNIEALGVHKILSFNITRIGFITISRLLRL